MKYAGLIITLLTVLLAPAQTTQEPATPSSQGVTQIKIAEIRIEGDSQPLILFDRAEKDGKGNCKVHHHPLKVALVPILYGLRPGPGEEYEAEKKEFPNAIIRYEAGCLIMSVKEAKVLHCQKCLEARQAWAKKQRGKS